jgi:Ca-activated chloride channel family protein
VSSTARSALFATYVAAAGKSAEELLVEDVRSPAVQQYVGDLQDAVDHYFPETLKLQTKIFLGPRFIHFAPLEEYMMPWMKLGKVNAESVPGGEAKAKPLDRKMVAIYPKEGTVWHNNPGAVLQSVPWTSEEHRAAARVLVEYLLEPRQQEKAMEWGFRPANPKVAYGSYLSPEYGIDPAKPTKLLGLVDPAVAEEIMVGWQEVKKPGVVMLVLDVSGSMAGEKLEQAKKGALKFIDTMSAGNHVGILTFSNTIKREVGIKPIAQNKFDLAAVVESARAEGGTALYDAVKRAVQMVDGYSLPDEAIRGVVLLSDGIRTDGRVALSSLVELRTDQEQVVTFLTEGGDKRGLHGSGLAFPTAHPIHIFSIAYGSDADLEVLRIFSEATNSTFNKATEKNITEVLEIFGKYF